MPQPLPSPSSPFDSSPVHVVSLPVTKQPQAVEVLSLAFLDDPIYLTMIPDPGDRRRALDALWKALILTCHRYGLVHTTPEVAGVACWLAPGHADLGLWQLLRTGLALPRAMMRFPSDSRKQFLEMVSVTDRIRHRHMPGRHWYLWALGVHPERQGQGIGSHLLGATLQRADASALPCYLETETEANVAFYARRGFAVVHDGEVAGLRMWAMLRAPSTGGVAPPGRS